MPGRVQRLHHRLELLHLLPALAGGGVGVVRREEADGVVAPVVAQALVEQRAVVDELVHRHQLDRGDAEPGQVVDDRGVGEPGVGAALLLGHLGVQLGQALDVRLVDDAARCRGSRGAGRPSQSKNGLITTPCIMCGRGVGVVAASRGRRSCSRTATGSQSIVAGDALA